MSDPTTLRNLVQTAMDAILERHDREETRRYFHRDFIQHNPWAEDGGAHVEAMCDFAFKVEMHRWAVQGDLVAYHGMYTAPNPLGEHPLVCVDIWRVQGGQIVEHWDALMPTPENDARIMVAGAGDGFASVDPLEVAANVSTVRRLLEVGVRGQDAEVIRSTLAPSFADHRPGAGDDGSAALLGWVEAEKPAVEVRKTVASGDLVFAQLLVKTAQMEQVVYDIFRFAHGRITDRWSVAQNRVPLEEAANPHPHF